MSWRVAKSLDVILSEINERHPQRSKRSDGSIGDQSHANRDSDHNPNSRGVVRARDFTHDPAGGLDCHQLARKLARMLKKGDHPALGPGAYVIFAGRIISRNRISEGWRRYDGSNPHISHLHLSVAYAPQDYDDTRRWWRPTRIERARRLLRQAAKRRPKLRRRVKVINRRLLPKK